MKRRAFAASSSLSCVLLLLTTASWIRSYWVYDQVAFGSFARSRWNWTAYSHSHLFPRWPPAEPNGASLTFLVCFGKLYVHETLYHADTEPLAGSRDHVWASDDNIIPTLSYGYAVTRDMSGKGWWTIREVTMPHWALVALFALTPAAWLLSLRGRGAPHNNKMQQTKLGQGMELRC